MRNPTVPILIVLVLAANTLSLTSADPTDHLPADGAGYVDAPETPPSDYICPTPDPLNLIDRTCSANDSCGGAEAWPLRATASSSGNVGGSGDTADWSQVEVYWNEGLAVDGSLAADTEDGLAIESGFGCSTSLTSWLTADHNGLYQIKVSSAVQSPYTLNFHIVSNDAVPGQEVGSTPADAYPVSALPNSLDPTRSITYKGSIPNREIPGIGPEMDHDLYRISTNLAALSDPTHTEGPAIGLLTVTAYIECNGGTYEFGFYGPDGIMPIHVWPTCGSIEASCITSGVLPVHAMFATTKRTGTGYQFNADLIPLYLTNLNDGVPRPYLLPSSPFCDLATSAALEVAGWVPGADLGLVNPDGLVVASTHAN